MSVDNQTIDQPSSNPNLYTSKQNYGLYVSGSRQRNRNTNPMQTDITDVKIKQHRPSANEVNSEGNMFEL